MRDGLYPGRSASGALAFALAFGLLEGPAANLPAAEPDGTPIAEVTFVAFDTETTGFSPTRDRVVEVGAVKYRDGEIIDQKSWLVNPQRSIPLSAQRVHGITPEMVRGQPVFSAIYPEVEAFMAGSVLLAHNARFDIAFLNAEVRRAGARPLTNAVLDSLSLFRTWYPEARRHSLEALAQHVQVDGRRFHRALEDSAYIVLILDKALRERADVDRLAELAADAGGTLSF